MIRSKECFKCQRYTCSNLADQSTDTGYAAPASVSQAMHATGCFVRDSTNAEYVSTFPFYNPEFCLGYQSWRWTIWPGIAYFGERVYRVIRSRRATRLSKVLVHPSGTWSAHLLQSCGSLTVH